MKTTYYTASTLDGFIATEDHNLDWLLTREIDNTGAGGYNDFISRIGALVMGANTYRWIHEHGSEDWEYTQPTWVITHHDDLPVHPGASVTFTPAPIPQVHADMMAAANGLDLWVVGGGDLAGQFADAGLLDEVVVSIAPVTIGAGKPLLPRHVELRLREVAQNGEFAVATYDVVKP